MERKLLIMRKNIKVSSLSEDQKKKFMKQSKKLCFHSFKVCCPDGYQILRFDPNLLINESIIQTCYNYLLPSLKKIKRQSENQDIVNGEINEIYTKYDNFKWNKQDNGYLNRKEFIKYGEKNYRTKSDDQNTAASRLFKHLRDCEKKSFRKFFKGLTLNEKGCEEIIDFLRLRTIKMKDGRPYIFEGDAKCEMELSDIKKLNPKKNYLNDPNHDTFEEEKKKFDKISKRRNEELDNYIKQLNNNKIRCIVEKHKYNFPNEVTLMNDNRKFVDELNEQVQDQTLNVLIDKLNAINYDLEDLAEETFENILPFDYVINKMEDDMAYTASLKAIYFQEEQDFLNDYKENSVENSDKLKNQSEAFWPIDSNGKEIGWKRYPIVMVKKEE